MIKEYFSNYFLHMSDVTFDMRDNSMEVHQRAVEPWRVTLVDTGAEHLDRRPHQAGGRLRRDDTFLLTYGDGVADVDIAKLVEFHRAHGKLATVTAVQPLGRFGAMQIAEDDVVGSSRPRRCRRSTRSPRATAPGSTVASSSWSQRSSTASRATTRCSRTGRSRAWPPTASSAPTAIRVLAADGHAARPAHARGPVGGGRRALGRVEAGGASPSGRSARTAARPCPVCEATDAELLYRAAVRQLLRRQHRGWLRRGRLCELRNVLRVRASDPAAFCPVLRGLLQVRSRRARRTAVGARGRAYATRLRSSRLTCRPRRPRSSTLARRPAVPAGAARCRLHRCAWRRSVA